MIKENIQKMNNPQFGSFGEYIFADYVVKILKKKIKKVHRDGVDFLFNNVNIDVGASRKLALTSKKRRRIPGKDVYVVFYKDCCFIEYPGNYEYKLRWSEVVRLYKKWSISREIKIPSKSQISYKKKYTDMTRDINSFFAENGYDTRIIYRTVSTKFGLNESPGNLLPKKEKERSISIYLDFYDFKRIESNIRFIIAFPDMLNCEIPRQRKISLKSGRSDLEKIDLTQIVPNKHECYFDSLKQLKNDFFKRY
jgi:hypothetical protein